MRGEETLLHSFQPASFRPPLDSPPLDFFMSGPPRHRKDPVDLSTEQVPVSAYVGSSKKLKDLKDSGPASGRRGSKH